MIYRKIYKPLGFLMAFLLLLISASPFPAEAFVYEEQALELHNLGLYQGIEGPVFDPSLASPVNRETGVVMLLRLLDLESAALAMPADEVEAILANFADAADISGWARSSVAYAVANGLVTGLPDRTFGPHLPLTGNAYCTLILRQLGFEPDYHLGAQQLGQMGVLTPEQMALLGPQELIRDYLVGISYGALSITRPGLLTPSSGLLVSISGPETVEAIAGNSGKIEFSLLPAAQTAVTYSIANNDIVEINDCEQKGDGLCTLQFTAKNPGTTTLTLVGSCPGYTPAIREVTVIVTGKASINGLPGQKQVAEGECSLAFQVVAPEGARVSAASSDSSIIDDVAVTGYGENRCLKFTARQPGQSAITVSISDGVNILASRQINITMVGRPVINGLDGVIKVDTGSCSLPFTVDPAGVEVVFLGCNSSNVSDISLDYNESDGSGTLDFWAGSAGTAIITLQASKTGYEVITQYVQIEVQAPTGYSSDSTQEITMSGLENVVVSGATLQYLPFTVDPSDAVITVTTQDNSAVVSGASIITALSSSDAPVNLLCFELDGAGTADAQITVTASRTGYSSVSQTITVSITSDPGSHVCFPGVCNYTKHSIATPASYEVTLTPIGAVPSVYYKNPAGTTVLNSVSLTNFVGADRNLAFWVNDWGIAELYLVGRSGNQLASGKSTVTVEP